MVGLEGEGEMFGVPAASIEFSSGESWKEVPAMTSKCH